MHKSRQQPLLVLGPARCPRSPVQLAAAGLWALVSWAGRAGLGCLLTWFSPHLRFLEEGPRRRPAAALPRWPSASASWWRVSGAACQLRGAGWALLAVGSLILCTS